MARKRMIDPSIWTDEGMLELNARQQLLYIGLFSNADDDGRIKANPGTVQMLLPTLYVGVSRSDIESDLDAVLAVMTKLVRYDVDGIRYLLFTNYRTWQKIEYPKASTLPEPPGFSGWPDSKRPSQPVVSPDPDGDSGEVSPNGHDSLHEGSPLDQRSFGEGSPNGHREIVCNKQIELDSQEKEESSLKPVQELRPERNQPTTGLSGTKDAREISARFVDHLEAYGKGTGVDRKSPEFRSLMSKAKTFLEKIESEDLDGWELPDPAIITMMTEYVRAQWQHGGFSNIPTLEKVFNQESDFDSWFADWKAAGKPSDFYDPSKPWYTLNRVKAMSR